MDVQGWGGRNLHASRRCALAVLRPKKSVTRLQSPPAAPPPARSAGLFSRAMLLSRQQVAAADELYEKDLENAKKDDG